MADGDEVSGRKEDPKVNCSPCSRKELFKPAAKFGAQCSAFFCDDCTEQHNTLLAFHPIKAIGSEDVQAAIVLPREVCPEHSKVVELYCSEHDKLGCATCMALEHRSCERVLYITKSTKELLLRSEIKKSNSQLDDMLKRLNAIKMKQEATLSDLDEQRKCRLEEIDAHHAQLQALLNNISKTSKDQVDHRYETMRADLQRHIENIETCLTDIKASHDRLNSFNDNAAQQFVELKKCQLTLKSTEQVTTYANENARLKDVDVSLDTRLVELLTDSKTLVTVKDPVRVKNKHVVNVSVSEDKRVCCRLYGTCVLTDGSVLLADYFNEKLKKIDCKSLSVTDHCSMKEGPTDVCCINDNEVVVAQASCLVFVSIQPRLAPIRTLTLDHLCRYVVYSDNELFVTDEDKSMYVYNMSGTLLRAVSTDDSGQNIFSGTRHVTVNEDGKKVFIVDADKGLVTVNRHGRVLATLTHNESNGSQGVCSDGSGGLFLCGIWSDNVVHVGRRGNVLSEVVSESDGLKNPQSLSYDIRNKILYVSQGLEENMLVFYLE